MFQHFNFNHKSNKRDRKLILFSIVTFVVKNYVFFMILIATTRNFNQFLKSKRKRCQHYNEIQPNRFHQL